ncbi:MAG: hypothetical protein WBB29_05525 [Geitlerinemataceae cyanobacterium]
MGSRQAHASRVFLPLSPSGNWQISVDLAKIATSLHSLRSPHGRVIREAASGQIRKRQ